MFSLSYQTRRRLRTLGLASATAPVVARMLGVAPQGVDTPMKPRPPAIVGCPYTEETPGNPNAHVSRNRGTTSDERPPALWKRALVVSGAQPFHEGLAERSRMGA